MANSSMNDEQNQLRRRAKRRLLGAIILVTALVVFLPMVLDGEPKPVSDDIAINIPSQDAKDPTSLPQKIAVAPPAKADPAPQPDSKAGESAKPAVPPPVQALTVLPGGQAPKPGAAELPHSPPAKAEPVKAETATEPAPTPAKAVAAPAKPAVAKPSASEAKPVEAPKPAAKPSEPSKPAAKSESSKETKPAATQGGFVVRLGAFAKPENAKQLKAKLSSMGIRNYSDLVKTPTGDKHRVRAGPYATQKEADAVRDRLKAANVVGDVVQKP